MSGGHFEFLQYRLTDITDELIDIITNNGKEMSDKELEERYHWRELDWYEKYPEDRLYSDYSKEVIDEFIKGLEIIKKAQIYIQRIDWLLSGDDGEGNFLTKLKDDLDKIKLYEKG